MRSVPLKLYKPFIASDAPISWNFCYYYFFKCTFVYLYELLLLFKFSSNALTGARFLSRLQTFHAIALTCLNGEAVASVREFVWCGERTHLHSVRGS